jgi:hypothetical protein
MYLNSHYEHLNLELREEVISTSKMSADVGEGLQKFVCHLEQLELKARNLNKVHRVKKEQLT